jgi:hypothetical protein
MNRTSFRKSRKPVRKTRLILVLPLACILFAGNALSQGYPVYDNAVFLNDIKDFATTIEQYGKEVTQYEAVLQHYEQQLISMEHMSFLMPQMQNTFTEIPADQGVDVACPGPSGVSGIIGGLLQMETPDMSQSITSSQLQICQQIVMRQNDKYNQTVKMINRLQTFYQPNVQSLSGQLDSVGTSEGAMNGAKGNAQINTAALDTEMNQWKAQIDADDKVIGMLQYNQSVLATKAMRGGNTILGNVVQAAALKAAFSTN